VSRDITQDPTVAEYLDTAASAAGHPPFSLTPRVAGSGVVEILRAALPHHVYTMRVEEGAEETLRREGRPEVKALLGAVKRRLGSPRGDGSTEGD
jgi:hypothetical protein